MAFKRNGPGCCSCSVQEYLATATACYEPGASDPTPTGSVSGRFTASLDGNQVYASSKASSAASMPVNVDGNYSITVTLVDGRTQTQTLFLSASKTNPSVVFRFFRFSTTGCQCFCDPPTTLSMVSAAPDCNYRMFQSCSLIYGPPPDAMRQLNFTSPVFTSPQTFVDPVTNSSFFYYFWCQYNQFFLTRIFPTSPFGSPYRDAILYTWVVGGYGNTCTPFNLQGGSPYPGSDASCHVTITG